MESNIKLLLGILVFSILLFGCTAKPASKEEVAVAEVEEKVEKPKVEEVPNVMEKKEVEEKTLGTGDKSIKESEIPEYDESKDKKLEDLIKAVK